VPVDAITQRPAVRAAVDKVALEMLGEHVTRCDVHALDEPCDQRAEELVHALGRFVGVR